MVKTTEEIMEQIKSRIGEDTSDEALGFLEDISDTLKDLDTRAKGDGTDWKQKYEDNDKEWRDKYRARFFSGDDNHVDHTDNHNDNEQEHKTPVTFEELFSSK